jgi:DNA polymerase-3 subunit beta
MNFLVRTTPGGLEIIGYDLEIGIRRQIPAQVQEEGAFTVSSKILTDIVNALPDSHVQFSGDGQGALNLTCDRSSFDLLGLPADDFPNLPEVGEESRFTLKAGDLKAMISQVAFAAATDDSRPVLAGVLVELSGTSITLASADGFRLSVRKAELTEAVTEDLSVIIPARALQELSRIIADQTDPIDLSVTPNKSQLLVRAGRVEFLSRLIDGHFPDFRQIVPRQYGTRLLVDRDQFLAAARRAKLFAQSSNDVVRIKMTPGESELDPGYVNISAQAAETGDNEDIIDGRVEGPESQIAFNGRYLTDVLAVMRAGDVAIEMTGPNAAGVLRSAGNDEFTHVIMPMVIGTN